MTEAVDELFEKFESLSKTIASENGLELYDVEYVPRNQLLRVFIYNPETVSATLDDCAKVDRGFTPYVEEEEWMPEELTLEVSSPGVYRHLRTPKHFELSVGEYIAFTLVKKLTDERYVGLPKKFVSEKKHRLKVEAVNENGFEVEVNGKRIEIEFENIKKANVEPAWEDIKAD